MSRTPSLVSSKRLAANRSNAAKSTGPRTPQGRARSAQNARKHGFTASTFAVVRLEDLQEIDHLRHDLVAVYQPVNSQELFAIERMALAQQAILRAARLEAGLFTTCLNQALEPSASATVLMNKELAGDGDIEIARAQNRNFILGVGFHRMAHQSNSFSLFLRYQAQAERNYRRAMEEFERLKSLRGELPEEELPNEPTTAPQTEQNETLCAAAETNPERPEDPAPTPIPFPPASETEIRLPIAKYGPQSHGDRCIS
ncbi:MAG: hypothetical protein ABSC23_01225 [Bryobacteraceae bacterium]|jgi:hypothetical protein